MDKLELKNKIADTSGLIEKIDYNAKISKIVHNIPTRS